MPRSWDYNPWQSNLDGTVNESLAAAAGRQASLLKAGGGLAVAPTSLDTAPFFAVKPTPQGCRRRSQGTIETIAEKPLPGWLQKKRESSARLRTILEKTLRHENFPNPREGVADMVGMCGKIMVMECPDCGAREGVRVSCRHKLCPVCAWDRRRDMLNAIIPLVQGYKAPRFLTLTFLSLYELRKEDVAWMAKCWRRFLAHPYVKKRIQGGVRAFEVTYNEQTETWHPHYHVIYDGEYIPQERVSAIWRDITEREYVARMPVAHPRLDERQLRGARKVIERWRDARYSYTRMVKGASVVDVRQVAGKGYRQGGRQAAVKELVKYITKVADYVASPERVGEFLAATHRIRQLSKFGTSHAYKAPPRPKGKGKPRYRVDPFTLKGKLDVPCACPEPGSEAALDWWLEHKTDPPPGRRWRKLGIFERAEARALLAGAELPPDPAQVKAEAELAEFFWTKGA